MSFSQLLSVRQLGRRHRDRKNQLWLMLSCYIPWSICPFISQIFLSLSAWVLLSIMSMHPFILASLCLCMSHLCFGPYVPKLYQPNTTMKLSLSLSTSTASSGKFICDSRSVSFTLHVFFQLAEAPVHYSEEHLGNHNSHGPAQKLMETHLRFFRGRFQKEPLPQEGSRGFVVFIPELKGWIGQKIRQTNG